MAGIPDVIEKAPMKPGGKDNRPVRKLLYLCAGLGITITLALCIAGWHDISLSFGMGSAMALIYLWMLGRQAFRMTLNDPGKAKKFAVMGLFRRYIFLIIILGIVISFSEVRIIYILAGLALIPASAIIYGALSLIR